MKIDGVFAGGGIRAYAFIGALQVLEEKDFKFVRLAGTSAGALFSAFIQSGYNSKEIEEMMSEIDLDTFTDPRGTLLPVPWIKWLLMYFRLGLYKGEALEQWIDDKLSEKGIRTFGDLPEGSLKIIASDITLGRILLLPDDLVEYGYKPESFSIARAVRMSAGIPYFYEPIKLENQKTRKKSVIVDGGVLSNFPIWLFMNEKLKKQTRPVMGFRLTPDIEEIPPNEINNALQMFHSLFETMRIAHDVKYIQEEHAKNIVFIPAKDVKATDFDISDEKKEALIQEGREQTKKFIRNWRY